MKTTTIAVSLVAALLCGCDDDTKGKNDLSMSHDLAMPSMDDLSMAADAASNDDLASGPDMAAGFPAAPTLGAQIDRLGRPGINTAATNPFWDTKGDGTTDPTAHQAVQDAYNKEGDPTKWAQFKDEIKASIAAFDGLDQSTALVSACHNQAGYAVANSYDTLAGALTDDELYVYSKVGTCQGYLAVETNALSGNFTPSDCGGRAPQYDVIDITYAALANQALLAPPIPDLDGVAPDTASSNSIYPFLADPF